MNEDPTGFPGDGFDATVYEVEVVFATSDASTPAADWWPGTKMTFPVLYESADKAAVEAEGSFTWATGARLIFAVVAGGIASLNGYWIHGRTHWFSLGAAVAFLVAFGFEIWQLIDRAEAAWYDARALAESTKTLAWRFAVRGSPFNERQGDEKTRFAEYVADLLEDAPDLEFGASGGRIVTTEMRTLREQPLSVRRDAYLSGRVDAQAAWYTKRAIHHRRYAYSWKSGLLLLELAGMTSALANAFNLLKYDSATLVSAAIGGGAAWLAMRQHDTARRSYNYASHELAIAVTRLNEISNADEKGWAAEVHNTEEIILREHDMWRAARVVLRQPAGRRAAAHTYRDMRDLPEPD